MRDQIWAYISSRYENDGVLVDCDEVYEAYQVEFDNFYSSDMIDEVMEDFISCSDLSGVKIEYEGEINEICFRRVAEEFELSSQTA